MESDANYGKIVLHVTKHKSGGMNTHTSHLTAHTATRICGLYST